MPSNTPDMSNQSEAAPDDPFAVSSPSPSHSPTNNNRHTTNTATEKDNNIDLNHTQSPTPMIISHNNNNNNNNNNNQQQNHNNEHSSSSPSPSTVSPSLSASHPIHPLNSSSSPLHLSSNIADGPALFASALQMLLGNSLVEVMEALETLLVYTKNLILYPDEKKYRKIKISNIHYQERLGHLPGAIEAMTAIGYQPIGDYLRLDEKRINDVNNTAVLKQMEELVTQQLNNVKKGWQALPTRLNDAHHYLSVKGTGSYSAIGKRHNMEDDEIIVDSFCGEAGQGYFGLYDGHGGRATVDFVVKALHLNLEQHLKRYPNSSLCDAFKQSYLATDGQLRRQNILRSGTTSVTCVVREEEARDGQGKPKRLLFTANVGDSRAVLCRGGKAVRLTIDHKASLPEEAKRIVDAGGFIGRNKRVNGVLAISRALGDHMLKENDVVSAEPYTSTTELTEEDTYILLACDGVWDVMTDQEAVDFMLQKLSVYQPLIEEFSQQRHHQPDDQQNHNNNNNNSDNNKNNDNNSNSMDTAIIPQRSLDSLPDSKVYDGDDDKDKIENIEGEILLDDDKEIEDNTIQANDTDTIQDMDNNQNIRNNNNPIHNPLGVSPTNINVSGGGNGSAPSPKNLNEILTSVAKSLVREALDRRSLDNVTVMIVAL